jgi:peptide chain release factor 2
VAVDFPLEIRALRQTFSSILEVSDLGRARERIAELSEAASAPCLWDEPERPRR